MEHAYGIDIYRRLPLPDPTTGEPLAAMPTFAALDLVYWSTAVEGWQAPSARILGFDAGQNGRKPSPGDIVYEDSGDGVARVIHVEVVSGNFDAGNDAAGFMLVELTAGDFADNSTIADAASGGNTIATVDAGTTGTYTLATNQIANTGGLPAFANGYAHVAFTVTETQCKQWGWKLVDLAGGPGWRSTGEEGFYTTDHEDAWDPKECVYTATLDNTDDAEQSTTAISFTTLAPTVVIKTGYYFVVVSGKGVGQAGYVKSYGSYIITPYVALDEDLDQTSTVKVYRDAKRVPAQLVSAEASSIPVGASTELAGILADTNELQTDDYPTTLTAIKAKTDNLPSDPADASDIADLFTALNTLLGTPSTSILVDVLARCVSAAGIARINAREALGLTITVGAGAHTGTSCLASDQASKALAGRPGVVLTGDNAGRAIKFTSDSGASGEFTYTDWNGDAFATPLAENDTIQV